MKSWKKRLKDELNCIVPKLDESVLNAPIPMDAETVQKEKTPVNHTKTWNFSWLKLSVAGGFTAVIALCLTLFFVLSPKFSEQEKDGVFMIEVNPSAIFALGDEGLVSSVMATNDDADLLLQNEEVQSSIIGKSAEQATRAFLDYSARLGFVSFDDNNAVRLTRIEDRESLDSLSDTVKDYFMSKGSYIAVVQNVAEGDYFLSELGIVAGEGDLQTKIESVPMLYSEREVEDKTNQEIEELYTQKLEEGSAGKFIENLLIGSLQKIQNRIDDASELTDLYGRISDKSEITPIYDYWIIRELEDTFEYEFSPEFSALLDEMQEKLVQFNKNYGVEINSYIDLVENSNFFASVSVDILVAIIENFSIASLIDNIVEVGELLRKIGVEIVEMVELPTSKEEYVEKMKNIFSMDYSERESVAKEDYSASRPAIESEENQSFIESIINQFGSLEDYWKSLL